MAEVEGGDRARRWRAAVTRGRATLARWWARRPVRIAAAVLAVPLVAGCFLAGYYYVSTARLIDERLAGARQRVLPRVFARALELRRGQALTDRQLVDRLNDLGYAERPQAARAGEFSVGDGSVVIQPRARELAGRPVRVVFRPPTPRVRGAARRPPPPRPADRVQRLEIGGRASDRLVLETPLLTSLISGEREKRRPVALAAIPERMVQAVLAIEDRRYFDHPGIDPIAMVRAVLSNLSGDNPYLSGASTITQQVVRNVFLPQFDGWTLRMAREQSGWAGLRRKLLEQFVALVLNTRASKDEILELYLNDMPLGQRGSFAIVGVAEAARLFFGKDVSNVTLAEAATIAGVLQSPSALSPFGNPDRSRERRNVVLQSMVDAGFVAQALADRAMKEPLAVVQRALEAEAPYFVDYVTRTLDRDYPGLTTTTDKPVEVYTTLDLHLQRVAQDAVRDGLTRLDQTLARRRRKGRAEASLVTVDPRTGDILAMVGGRSYNQSQFNRAIAARRQPGSVFKPFVYLAAFEHAAESGDAAVTPASLVDDTPTTWEFNEQAWTPENYEDKYDGVITFRRALAFSRNVAAVKVAEQAGYDRVADLWKKLRVGAAPRAYPSIALGVFEASPYEIATAYTIFPNLGLVRPLQHVLRIDSGGHEVTKKPRATPRAIARPDTTFLVMNMLRSVINEGTAASVRGAGFALDAAGKTGTTNDLRDAWFVGFTPELLTVVWVGFDDNQPLGLSGSQAALPIWTQFMTRALAGRASVPFDTPDGISFVDIDPETGSLASPACPRVIREAFLAGTEPLQACERHR
jgi:penicillin-binding protein 1B